MHTWSARVSVSMGPDPLVDSYARYKRGTSKLIEWLCNGARVCGVRIALDAQRYSTSLRSVKVLTADLPRYASTVVASSSPRIEITLEVLEVTKDAIAGRKHCHNFYMKFAGSDISSNQRHAHFIAILEQVYDTLRKEYKNRLPKRKKKIPIHAADSNDLNNLFCHLGLEDTETDIPNDAPQTESKPDHRARRTRKTPVANRTTLFELEGDEEEEKSFAIWCLLKDCHQLRSRVQTVWEQYSQGEISFLTATKVTEYSLAIIQNLGNNFKQRNADLSSFANVLDFLRIEQYLQELEQNGCASERWDMLCLESWYALNDFQYLMAYHSYPSDHEQSIPMLHFKPHPFAQHLLSISKDFAEMLMFTRDKKLESNKVVLRKAVSRLETIRHGVDAFTRKVIDLITGDKIDIASVYFMQIYCDMHDKLDGHLSRGMLESIEAHRCVQATCTQARRFFQNHKGSNAAVHYHCAEPWILTAIEDMIKQNQVENGKEGWIMRTCGCERQNVFIPLNLVKTLPLLPMRYANLMLSKLQRDGAAQCCHNTLVLSAAHLQNAVALCGALNEPWEDMDHLVAGQSSYQPFLRQANGTILGAAKQYSMALGRSLTHVMHGKPALPGPNQIAKQSMIVDRIDLIADSHDHEYKLSKTEVYYESIRRHAARGGIKDPAIAAQWKNTKKLNTDQLLQVLLEITVSEEPYFNFDYWTFADNCGLWLGKVLDSYLTRYPRPGARLGTWNVVHDILWNASAAEMQGKNPEDTFLGQAGNELNMLLQSSMMSIDLKARGLQVSSGHIDLDCQPAVKYAGIGKLAPPDLKNFGIMVWNLPQIAVSKASRIEKQLGLYKYDQLVQKLVAEVDSWWAAKRNIDQSKARLEYKAYIQKVLSDSGYDAGDGLDDMVGDIRAKKALPVSSILLAGRMTLEHLEHVRRELQRDVCRLLLRGLGPSELVKVRHAV